MTRHSVRSFAEELELLAGEVARMGGLAERQTMAALEAVARRDTDLADRVIAGDAAVDEAQREIDRKVIRLLALRQPLAQDLRQAIAALKIASNLERVGDLARNIAKRAQVLNEFEPMAHTRTVDRMGRVVVGHLNTVLDAYARGQAERAMTVWSRDDDVDAHYHSLFRELLTFMTEDQTMIGPGAHLLFIAKNIERIGDHATNIAETVHFAITGEELARERPKIEQLAGAPRRVGGE